MTRKINVDYNICNNNLKKRKIYNINKACINALNNHCEKTKNY